MNDQLYLGPGVVLRFGELFLKGKNRYVFEQALERNVRSALIGRDDVAVIRKHGRIFVKGAGDADLMTRLRTVFGIASLSRVIFCEKHITAIESAALALCDTRPVAAKTFRIAARRSDKNFPLISSEIGREVGAKVAAATGLGVDLTEPDYTIGIEVGTEWTFLWSDTEPGAGGLPVGTSGEAMLLLSGGIDSPVAGHMMQRRGLRLRAVYFHAFPYTGDGAKDKVIRLARVLARRQGAVELNVVPFTPVQEMFRDQAEAKLLVILYRRAMVRIAAMLANKHRIIGLVTGESLGQVASQTLHNLQAIEDAAPIPILRPLIGMDKNDIIAVAKQIDTFDISILPHDDCCSLFVPRHPETHAGLKFVWRTEARIDWRETVETAARNTEIITVTQ